MHCDILAERLISYHHPQFLSAYGIETQHSSGFELQPRLSNFCGYVDVWHEEESHDP